MFRLLHTADWQIGMMAPGLGASASAVRAARLAGVERVLKIAADRQVDAILVAGDQFEDNQVSASLAEKVVTLLNDRTRIPTWIIPGNHDPLTRDSIYHRPMWQQLAPHVHVVGEGGAVRLADGVSLYACPLTRRNGMEDPTAWIPPREEGGGLRVGLAHGTMRIRPDVGDDDFPIPRDAAERRGLDYLALGHWHSTLSDGAGRCWYSGTHETTKFGERDSGNVLVVTLESAGAAPKVESVRCGSLCWTDHTIDLDRQTLEEAMAELRRWPGAEMCLMRVMLCGEAKADVSGGVEALRTMLGERMLYHECDGSGLRMDGGESLAAALAGSPYLMKTAARLGELAKSGDGVEGGVEGGSAAARRALQLLHKAAWESGASGKKPGGTN